MTLNGKHSPYMAEFNNPDFALLRLSDVLRIISISDEQWRQWVKQGRAPKPKKIGSMTVWRMKEIREFCERTWEDAQTVNG